MDYILTSSLFRRRPRDIKWQRSILCTIARLQRVQQVTQVERAHVENQSVAEVIKETKVKNNGNKNIKKIRIKIF